MLYVVIERYKNRDPKPVYRRHQAQGRLMPEGLKYIDSWAETSFDRCFQLMETDDPALFEQWMVHRKDLVDFEIVQVMTSAEAAVAAMRDERQG